VLKAQREGKHGPIPENLPDGVSTLLRSLLGRDPQERPFSAQKLRRTLDPYLPDGAAVTRQPTKTFANVPEAKKGPTREPTGTLRPPAPPSAGPKATVMGLGTTPPAAGRVSVPPPPPSSAKIPAESTQRLDIEQILTSAPAQPRLSAPPPPPRASLAPPASPRVSVPPPPPASPRVSTPPAAPGAAQASAPRPFAQDPTQAIDFAEVLDDGEEDELPARSAPEQRPTSELTQPIRLEQVLAVAEAKKRMSVPPPSAARASLPQAAPSAPVAQPPMAPPMAAVEAQSAPGETQGAPVQAQSAPAVAARPAATEQDDAATVLHDYAPQSAQSAQDADITRVDAPIFAGSDFSLDATLEQPAPRAGESDSIAAADDHGNDGDPDEDEATSVSFKPAARALASQKKTLIGRGAPSAPQPNMSLDLETSAVTAGTTPTADYERSSEARNTSAGRAEYEDTLNGGETFARSRPNNLKQYLPFAAAAVLLLSVGGGLVAALSGDEPKVASVSEAIPTPAALPPPIVPQPAVMPLAVAPGQGAPLPSVVPVDPSVADTLPSADEEEEREARLESRGSHHRSSRREHKREERAAKTSSASSKGDSKEERWAKARQEAQAFYAAKKYKQAAQAYEIAAKNNPTHAGTFAGLGASRLKAGDARGAVQAYQKAVQISPSTSGFHAALGRAYAAMGDKSKARAAYKRALALDPKNEAAKQALKELG